MQRPSEQKSVAAKMNVNKHHGKPRQNPRTWPKSYKPRLSSSSLIAVPGDGRGPGEGNGGSAEPESSGPENEAESDAEKGMAADNDPESAIGFDTGIGAGDGMVRCMLNCGAAGASAAGVMSRMGTVRPARASLARVRASSAAARSLTAASWRDSACFWSKLMIVASRLRRAEQVNEVLHVDESVLNALGQLLRLRRVHVDQAAQQRRE